MQCKSRNEPVCRTANFRTSAGLGCSDQNPGSSQLWNAIRKSFDQEFEPYIDDIKRLSCEVKEEIQLAKAQADEQDKQLQKAWREAEGRSRSHLRGMLWRTSDKLDAIKDMQLQQKKRLTG